MWTAKLIEKKYSKEDLKVKIEYSNGIDIINKIYSISEPNKDVIKNIIRNKIQNLNALKDLNSTFVKGDIDLTVTPTIPIVLPADEKAFIEDLSLLIKLKSAVDLELIQTDDSKLINVRTRVITALNNNPLWIKYITA